MTLIRPVLVRCVSRTAFGSTGSQKGLNFCPACLVRSPGQTSCQMSCDASPSARTNNLYGHRPASATGIAINIAPAAAADSRLRRRASAEISAFTSQALHREPRARGLFLSFPSGGLEIIHPGGSRGAGGPPLHNRRRARPRAASSTTLRAAAAVAGARSNQRGRSPETGHRTRARWPSP